MRSVISGYSAGDIRGLVRDIQSIARQSGDTIDAWFCLGDVLLPGGHGETQEEEKACVNQLLAGQALSNSCFLLFPY